MAHLVAPPSAIRQVGADWEVVNLEITPTSVHLVDDGFSRREGEVYVPEKTGQLRSLPDREDLLAEGCRPEIRLMDHHCNGQARPPQTTNVS
jgi:hypothetical protein